MAAREANNTTLQHLLQLFCLLLPHSRVLPMVREHLQGVPVSRLYARAQVFVRYPHRRG